MHLAYKVNYALFSNPATCNIKGSPGDCTVTFPGLTVAARTNGTMCLYFAVFLYIGYYIFRMVQFWDKEKRGRSIALFGRSRGFAGNQYETPIEGVGVVVKSVVLTLALVPLSFSSGYNTVNIASYLFLGILGTRYLQALSFNDFVINYFDWETSLGVDTVVRIMIEMAFPIIVWVNLLVSNGMTTFPVSSRHDFNNAMRAAAGLEFLQVPPLIVLAKHIIDWRYKKWYPNKQDEGYVTLQRNRILMVYLEVVESVQLLVTVGFSANLMLWNNPAYNVA